MRTNGGLPSTPSDESDDDKLPSSDDGLMGLPGDDDEDCSANSNIRLPDDDPFRRHLMELALPPEPIWITTASGFRRRVTDPREPVDWPCNASNCRGPGCRLPCRERP